MYISKEITSLHTKEQAIMAVAGAFNLSEMYSSAGLIEEMILINETLKKALLFAEEFFYSDNLYELSLDLYNLGIISNIEVIYGLLGIEYPKTLIEEKEQINLDYPVVGIVGRGNAGKETTGKILRQNYESFHFVLADRLREIALTLGIYPPFNLPLLRAIDAEIKPNFGKETFVRWTLARAKNFSSLNKPKLISVDGFRSVKETEWFLKQKNTILVAITADAKLRFERGSNRNQNGEDTTDFNEFIKSDRIEGDWIDPIIPMAKHTFNNNGSLDDLENQVLEFFSTRLQDL